MTSEEQLAVLELYRIAAAATAKALAADKALRHRQKSRSGPHLSLLKDLEGDAS